MPQQPTNSKLPCCPNHGIKPNYRCVSQQFTRCVDKIHVVPTTEQWALLLRMRIGTRTHSALFPSHNFPRGPRAHPSINFFIETQRETAVERWLIKFSRDNSRPAPVGCRGAVSSFCPGGDCPICHFNQRLSRITTNGRTLSQQNSVAFWNSFQVIARYFRHRLINFRKVYKFSFRY